MVPIRRVLPLILTLTHLVLVTIYMLSISHPSRAMTELCNPNRSTTVYQFTFKECPFGVLFALPMTAECLKSASDNDQSNFYADVCENLKYDPESSKTIQLIGTITETDLAEEDSCKGPGPNQCDVSIKTVGKSDISEPGDDLTIAMELNYDEPEEVSARRNDSNVLEQTFRLFKFIVGLDEDKVYVQRKKRAAKGKTNPKGRSKSSKTSSSKEESPTEESTTEEGVTETNTTETNTTGKNPDGTEPDLETEENFDSEGPNLRVMDLLRLSFKILTKHCDPAYVSKKFNRDIQRMFIFLLQESDTSQMQDVSVEEHKEVMKALGDCLSKQRAFALNGTSCRTYARVKLIEKNGHTRAYQQNEFSYKPSLYDIPIDATWATVDFVHGLCYGTFPEHINNHHLYQQAMERVFNDAMIYRWNHPPELYRPEIWDHMLSTNVRSTMQNLDVCVHGAYYDTPFSHRLERPLQHFNGTRSVLVTKPPKVSIAAPVAKAAAPVVAGAAAPAAGGVTPDPNAPTPDPNAATTAPDPNAPTPDPNAATTAPDPNAPTPDPNAPTPDPNAATTAPDPNAPTPDPNAPTPDPNAATTAPDPNAATTAPDPNAATTAPDPNAAGGVATEASLTQTTTDSGTDTGTTDTPEAAPAAARRRRKRSNPLTLDEFGLSEAGWCFQTDEQQRKIVQKYVEANCPDSAVLKQFKESKESNSKKGNSTEDSSESDSGATDSPDTKDSNAKSKSDSTESGDTTTPGSEGSDSENSAKESAETEDTEKPAKYSSETVDVETPAKDSTEIGDTEKPTKESSETVDAETPAKESSETVVAETPAKDSSETDDAETPAKDSSETDDAEKPASETETEDER